MKIFKTTKKKRLESLEKRLARMENNLVNAGVLRRTGLHEKILYGLPQGLSAGCDITDLKERLNAVERVPSQIGALAERFGVEFEWVEDHPKHVCRDKTADPE